MKIGLIGIGMLGNAVGLHLLQSGFQLTAFNRTEEKTNELKKNGAQIVSTPKQVAENSDIVITVIKDSNAVKQVSFETDGIIYGNHKDLVVCDMSTINPLESKNIAEKFLEHNISMLDTPVMGGPNVAITGDLVMMVAGNKNTFDKCKEVFDAIANKVFFLGENGTAHAVKLAMNLQITMLATGMSENKAFKMIQDKFDATFTLENLKKDINTISETSKLFGLELPMIKRAEKIFESAEKEGFGKLDYTGILAYLKKLNEKN
jgi:3-hydroxyisobutyrate dehydrogenase